MSFIKKKTAKYKERIKFNNELPCKKIKEILDIQHILKYLNKVTLLFKICFVYIY